MSSGSAKHLHGVEQTWSRSARAPVPDLWHVIQRGKFQRVPKEWHELSTHRCTQELRIYFYLNILKLLKLNAFWDGYIWVLPLRTATCAGHLISAVISRRSVRPATAKRLQPHNFIRIPTACVWCVWLIWFCHVLLPASLFHYCSSQSGIYDLHKYGTQLAKTWAKYAVKFGYNHSQTLASINLSWSIHPANYP